MDYLGEGVTYERRSDKKENNSVQAQNEFNISFAERENIKIVKSFSDEGKTGSNFDREGWKEMIRYIRASNGRIKYVVCYRWDRIARVAGEAITLIQNLEQELNVTVISGTEHIGLSPTSPSYFKWRATIFVDAEYYLRVIKEQIKRGVRRGREEGRLCGVAPYGWNNKRNERNKAIVLINEDEAKIVKSMFENFVYGGMGLKEVEAEARKQGFTRKGNSAVRRVLENALHCGIIYVPEFYQQEGFYTKVEPFQQIVSDSLYWSAQELLKSCKKKSKLSEELPLRGILKCEETGTPLTGGKSKSKTGKYHWYYRSNFVKGQNHSATKAHEWIREIFSQLSFSDAQIKYIKKITIDRFGKDLKEREGNISAIKSNIKNIDLKLDGLEKRYIEGNALSDDVYKKWRTTYESEKLGFKLKLEKIEKVKATEFEALEEHINKFADLAAVWDNATLYFKRKLFCCIFSEDVILTKEGYRTQYINHWVRGNSLNINHLTFIEGHKKTGETEVTPASTRGGN